MSDYAKILLLSFDSAEATKTSALKAYYRSVRLIKDSNNATPSLPSTSYSILLNGNCMDQENRKLYTFYLDTYYNQAWIFEIDIDTRKQTVVFFDSTNRIGFNGQFKIYNPRVVQGRLIWTDNNMPEYQMDVKRAKKSFYYGIGYGQYPTVTEWNDTTYYLAGMIIWKGRYFYKCLLPASNVEPLAWPSYWERLCLVEEAYYSTDPYNYYFAPMPPKFNPVVQYISDNERKPNNLRQTIWQFAYRYIYMDYRKSTFSPACVPDMPDSEEEITTGLANELTELNNCIKIRINTGGEEVRKIEIIGRSTQDPSTWYLVEVIDLFDEVEGTQYKSESPISESIIVTIIMTIPLPVVVNNSIATTEEKVMASAVLLPVVLNMYLMASNVDMQWAAEISGIGSMLTSIITGNTGGAFELISKPGWVTIIETAGGTEITDGTISLSGIQMEVRRKAG
jgi:hypothetical protein